MMTESGDRMKILFCDWTSFGDRDIVEALRELSHTVFFTQLNPETEKDSFRNKFITLLEENMPDAVFTLNFNPEVAECCHQAAIKYISWVYDSPQLLLYKQAILYDTNYVFLFDSMQYESLVRLGAGTVYYMPLAANAKRIDDMLGTDFERIKYDCDIAFVGSLYNDGHNFYDRLAPRLSEFDRGYLDALMEAQTSVYGRFFLEDVLRNSPVLERLCTAMPYGRDADSFADDAYIYGNYFLGRKLTSIERIEILTELAGRHQVHIHTDGDTSMIPGIRNRGCVEYFEEAPAVFRQARINLNISLRTIQNGIPLRCFDIMASGGFLLTNFQMDFLELFEAGTDYVYFESHEDLYEKAAYYLAHEEERREIARHGHDTMLRCHSYHQRLCQMLDIAMQRRT